MAKKKIAVLTGAGVSAESGLSTFRGSGGLWGEYDPQEVASIEGWYRNRKLVLSFYNQLRKQLSEVKPNAAHRGLVELEKYFDVDVITQNVDDLHERAGSSNVLHLHGELMKVRSLRDESRVYQLPCDQLTDKGLVTSVDTRDSYGDPVRPHIVFFQEAVPNFDRACMLAQKADVFVVIGTSLVVYPAASLLHYAPRNAQVYYIDPNPSAVPDYVHVIAKPATEGVAELFEILTKQQ